MICIFLFIPSFIFSNEFSNYLIQKVNSIPVGKEESMIGWRSAYAGCQSGPITFTIKNNLFYIPDITNQRINVYNDKLEFIKTINEKGKKIIQTANRIIVDDKKSIIAYTQGYGLKKINDYGETIFYIKYDELPNEIKSNKNFFPTDDIVMIYNDNNGIEYITPDGKIIKDEKATKKMEELTGNRRKIKRDQTIDITLPADKTKIVDNLRKDPSLLLIDDEYYSTSFIETEKYFDKIKEVREYVKEQKKKNNVKYRTSNININIDGYAFYTFIDYDKDHNDYWEAGKDEASIRKAAIIIFTKYGELLDAFYYGQYRKIDGSLKPDYTIYPTSEAKVAISPDGDIYFLKSPIVTFSKTTVENPVPKVISGDMVYTFYKIERQW